MSYRHAWSSLRAAEERIGRPLLVRQRGGKNGGGASLTPYARALMQEFMNLDHDVREFVDKRYRQIFHARTGKGRRR